jgi:hypothetical protein
MFKNIFFILLIFFFQTASLAGASDNFLLKNRYWDSGKAEFQIYKAKISRYGIPRESTVKIIIVKESFDTEKMVKTLKTSKASEVIKMNYIQTVPSGVYDYFQMASFFFDRQTGSLIKYTMSSQDGCGNTYMQYVYKNNNHRFCFHSYFDDEGDIQIELPSKNPLVFYDTLPLVLRFRLKDKKSYNMKVVSPLISSRFSKPVFWDAEITNRAIDSIMIGARKISNIYESTVKINGKSDIYYFESDFPNRLIKCTLNNSDELLIKNSRFFYYWKYNNPGDTIDAIK